MSVADISKLPLREKFQIMEAIWEDLRQHVEKLGLPAEHRQLLEQRRERVATGEASLREWDDVKHSIGRR